MNIEFKNILSRPWTQHKTVELKREKYFSKHLINPRQAAQIYSSHFIHSLHSLAPQA